MNSSKEIATKMEIEPIFREKRIIHRKKQSDENVNDETTQSTEEYFRINYFLYVVDQAISSIESRFEQFQIDENIFGFLFNFEKLLSAEATVTGIVNNILKAIHAFGKDRKSTRLNSSHALTSRMPSSA